MTMSVKDFRQLKGMMARTTSDNDNEALTSIRMANGLLKKHSLTWEQVFARTVTVVEEFEAADDPPPPSVVDVEKREVDEAFAILADEDLSGSFADFIADLERQWRSTKHLSAGQRDAVFKAARRASTKHR